MSRSDSALLRSGDRRRSKDNCCGGGAQPAGALDRSPPRRPTMFELDDQPTDQPTDRRRCLLCTR